MYPTYIVWGRGAVGAALRDRNGVERLGACDDWDLAQAANQLVSAGVAERQEGGGVVMRSSADEPWCCVTIGKVDESELDADPAVIGYQTAMTRETPPPAGKPSVSRTARLKGRA